LEPGRQSQRKLNDVLRALDDMEGRAVTNRTLLYRLESYGYSKDDEDAIERVVDRGRRAGRISWDAISDGRSTVDAPWEIVVVEAHAGDIMRSLIVASLPKSLLQQCDVPH
jgi:hypothetical protein